MNEHQMSSKANEADLPTKSLSSSSAGLTQLFDLYSEYRAHVVESVRRIRKDDSQPQFAVESFDDFCRFWQRLHPRDQTIWERRLRSGYEKELERIRRVLATSQPASRESRPAA